MSGQQWFSDDVFRIADIQFYFNRTPEFIEKGVLRFKSVSKFRLGPTNAKGWHLGQCRYSKLAPAWGEFYELTGLDPFAEQPTDWQPLGAADHGSRHFLFYFRDNTFEATAMDWQFEPIPSNALLRLFSGRFSN